MPVYHLTLDELVTLVHRAFPTLENADVRENSIEFSVDGKRYWACRWMDVYQSEDGYIFVSETSLALQEKLRRVF